MNSKIIKRSIMFLLGAFMITACSNQDNPATPTEPVKPSTIMELAEKIASWNKAYVTDLGYFCYSDEMAVEGAEPGEKFSNLTFMDKAGNNKLSIIISKDRKLPSQIIMEKGILYFSFPNDSILELVYDDNEKMIMLDSIPFKVDALQAIIAANSYDGFKSILSNFTALMNNASKPIPQIQSFKSVADVVIGLGYAPEGTTASGLATGATGQYDFATMAENWYKTNVLGSIYYKLAMWTGKATFKVGGSSCTLSGTIWCPVNTFNKYGTYGILCDENKDNLFVGKAEYEGTGYQDASAVSYDVDFRGLKPNTTYYYRAYYKFNDADHGGLIFKYGSPTDQVGYDAIIKSFTTGANMLSVDVVMCIDVTGSMSNIISTVKRNALDFYDLFKASCEEEGITLTGLNTQVITFGDKNVDGDGWLTSSPTYLLPEQKTEFEGFVNPLYANGGGDTPESGLEALDLAFKKTDWGADDGYHRQVVILWTDAPYLNVAPFTDQNIGDLEARWNTLPSGRRMILFAPSGYGDGYEGNGGDWVHFDSWKNVMHETDLYSGFSNFSYILKSIIGELTGKEKPSESKASKKASFIFRSNE